MVYDNIRSIRKHKALRNRFQKYRAEFETAKRSNESRFKRECTRCEIKF
jgi:hypothetical protein